MVDCLLYLENAIKLHEKEDKICALLFETDWTIFRLLDPNGTLLTVQKLLEGD